MTRKKKFETHEEWLKAEGILKDVPRIPVKRSRKKSIDGQQHLFAKDETGRPEVHRTKKRKTKKKKETV